MKSEELAQEVEHFIQECRSRVTGVGDEQYSEGDTQKFERMSVDQLFDWAEEEIQDVAVYATMLHIRLSRLRKVVSERLNGNVE